MCMPCGSDLLIELLTVWSKISNLGNVLLTFVTSYWIVSQHFAAVFSVIIKFITHACINRHSHTVHTDPNKYMGNWWNVFYCIWTFMAMWISFNSEFYCLCFSFRSCTQTSTVVGSLPQTGKTKSQRLNLRSSTSRQPKLSASGTKPTKQDVTMREVTVFTSYLSSLLLHWNKESWYIHVSWQTWTFSCCIWNTVSLCLIHVLIWASIQAGRLLQWWMCVFMLCVRVWYVSDSRVRWRQVHRQWLLTAVHISYFYEKGLVFSNICVQWKFLYPFYYPPHLSSLLLADTDVCVCVYVSECIFGERICNSEITGPIGNNYRVLNLYKWWHWE